ncbi:Sushi repeat-containing protein SRPX2 [Acipenser ruthenus]|uniref:Sushi repeat-containing protein SRPX2 n=1 Tax=Acipenser ruthenus TaxID=7906 RepID=A0A662YM47_ACIRT|nr:Sushi repeat-containing protein SRPX2 [Acipenser ruthenus]
MPPTSPSRCRSDGVHLVLPIVERSSKEPSAHEPWYCIIFSHRLTSSPVESIQSTFSPLSGLINGIFFTVIQINTDVRSAAALLDQFYEKRRILIVSTPDISNQYYKLQNIMVQRAGCGLDLRQVTVIELLGLPPREVGRIKENRLSSEVIEELRQAMRISQAYFTMVLVDKQGMDRERYIDPVTSDELFSYIDTYMLSTEERERMENNRDHCD